MSTLPPDQIAAFRQQHYQATLVGKQLVHDDLVILRVRPDHPLMPHRAGQYTTLGLGTWELREKEGFPEFIPLGEENRLIRRQYSISHPMLNEQGELIAADPTELEFYIVRVTGETESGPMLTPRLFNLRIGDRLFMGDKITGFYTLNDVQADHTVLLFSTGTGEAPHNYMLWELLRRGHCGPILAACCVRFSHDLGYRAAHETLVQRYPQYKYIPLATRDPGQMSKLYLQDLLTTGELEHRLGHKLDPAKTRAFLCGNPHMIGVPLFDKVTKAKSYPTPVGMVQLLEERGFTADSRAQKIKGNVHFEEYW